MSKTLVIAVREYLAAVKTKGFLVGLILMPLLMGGGVVMQSFTKGLEDPTPRTIAVLDRTRNEALWPALKQAAERRRETAQRTTALYHVERVEPPTNQDGLDAARLALSDRIRRGELTALLEIAPNAMERRDPQRPATAPAINMPAGLAPPDMGAEPGDEAADALFFTTNRPALGELRDFVRRAVEPHVVAARLGQSPETVEAVARSSREILVSRGLARRSLSNEFSFEPRTNEVATLMLPVAMVVVMLMVVLVGASPLTTNIIEEKQLRIAEVLVGSVTPFTLMLGKLLGGVATSLTLGAIYIVGAAAVANQLGLLDVLSVGLVIWFVVFTVVASLMYGAMFVVAGSAATNVKEAQALMTPMMLIVVMPMFLVGPLMNEPHGKIGLFGTFFPLTAPLVTMMRLTTPPPIGWWQPVLALLSSGLMTVVLVWIAGRVFRAGFLLLGRPAKFRELIGWIVKG
ncbi:MAG TPA: ABC transporter permease [Tepidisphaeraceae bacterium]|jgi:ABC-2 type transport system permease protein